MSEAGRWDKLGRLVYDGSGGHLAYANTSANRFIYPDQTTATFTRNPTGDVGYYRYGEDAVFSTALAEMQSATWYTNHTGTSSAYSLLLAGYRVQQSAIGWQINDPASRRIASVTFNVTEVGSGVTWRVGWRSGPVTPAVMADWSWTDDAPSITGTTTGVQTLTVGAVCTDNLWLILTLSPYPSGGAVTDKATVAFSPCTITV